MLAIRVLGELELELDGQRIDPPPRQSGRLLLAYLAMTPGLHARGDLAALLWPDILESSARGSLRSAIAAVRRTLGSRSDRYLLASGDALGLTDDVTVDVRQFEALVGEGELEAALELARGPLLQGLGAEWVRHARAEHLDRLSQVLELLAQRAEKAGALEQAIRYTRRQVALSPLAEPANRELMRRLTAAGDRASALAVYSALAESFRRELQAVPSPATRQMAEEARRGASAQTPPRIPLPVGLRALLDDPFVGRGGELEILSRALDSTRTGAFHAVLVSGEPGIGKTALLARLATQALSHATVLFGRCRRPASAPLEPFVEALRYYADATPPERLHALDRSGELAALIPGIGGEETAGSAPADLLPDGRRISRAVVETFISLARDRPLVLLVDDLHDADRATAEVAARLIDVPPTTPMLVVLTLRDTELGRSPLLQRLTSQVRSVSSSTEISLRGLGEEAVATLARAMGREEIAADAVSELHLRTAGNPFLINHLLGSSETLSGSSLPPRVQDLVWQEVDRLGGDARACVSVASVTGDEFDLSTVARVVGYGDDRVLDALDEAVLAKVLVELPTHVGRYQFRHHLLREAIYELLTATRRAHLHRRVADALISRRSEEKAVSLVPIVEHLRAARDLVPTDELGQYVLQAAEEAERQGVFADAAGFYSEYIDLLGSGSAERRAQTLVPLGHVARRAGLLERARSALVQARTLADELEDQALQVAATVGLCALPFVPGDRPPDPEMIAMLEGALELPSAADPAIRAQLLARLALEAFYDPTRARPDALAEEAVALARQSDDARAGAAALTVGHLAFRGADGPPERVELARVLASRARAAGDAESLMSALLHHTVAQVELGDLGTLEGNARQVVDAARELRQPAYGWWAYLWRATEAITRGHLDEGVALSRRAYELGHVTFGAPAELELRAQQAWIALEQERFDEILGALTTAKGAFSALPVWQSLTARVRIATGPQEPAARSVADLTAHGLAMLERDTNWLISATLLAETVAHCRDVKAAEDLFARLQPRRNHWAVSARGTVCLGPVAAPLALLAAAIGDVDEAQRFYALAQQRCVAAGAELAARRLERQYRRATPSAIHPATG